MSKTTFTWSRKHHMQQALCESNSLDVNLMETCSKRWGEKKTEMSQAPLCLRRYMKNWHVSSSCNATRDRFPVFPVGLLHIFSPCRRQLSHKAVLCAAWRNACSAPHSLLRHAASRESCLIHLTSIIFWP